MKCRNWTGRLPSLLDEPSGSPGRLGLEAHLRECGGCRNQWMLLNRLKEASKGLDGQVPEENVWQGIQGELAGQEAEAPKKPVPLGPMVRLALGWGASLAVVLVAAIWLWPRPAGRDAPREVNIGPAVTVAEVPEVQTAEPRKPAPVRAARRSVPSARPQSPAPSEPRYLLDGLASAEDMAEPAPRVQYMLPAMSISDIEGDGGGLQYIMPAVCSTVREPF